MTQRQMDRMEGERGVAGVGCEIPCRLGTDQFHINCRLGAGCMLDRMEGEKRLRVWALSLMEVVASGRCGDVDVDVGSGMDVGSGTLRTVRLHGMHVLIFASTSRTLTCRPAGLNGLG